jgi:DivIVA domain-containing protein
MMWVFAILIVLALGGVALVAATQWGGLDDAMPDRPDALVPATGELTADDLRRVRFSVTLRGYRMSEVDALLRRLAAEADARASTTRAGTPRALPPAVGATDDVLGLPEGDVQETVVLRKPGQDGAE